MLIKGIIKQLQIFATATIVATTPYSINQTTIDKAYIYNKAIERQATIDELDSYVLQGICKMDNNYLVTAYDSDKEKNSLIYILDEKFNLLATKELETNAHVGGIAYDNINQNIWITDIDGKVKVYDKKEITNKYKKQAKSKKTIYIGEHMNNIYGVKSIAYITIKDNKLFVGNFNADDKSILKEYPINEDGYIDRKKVKISKLTANIQGINFYEKDNKTYLITSSSFGRYFNTELRVYEYKNTGYDYREKEIGIIYTPPMMEEIEILDGKIITVYESNAEIYKTLTNRNNKDLIIVDLDEIINNNKAKEMVKTYKTYPIEALYEDKKRAL